MESINNVDRRLIELEIKASFVDDLLDQLNQVVVRQQQQIDVLTREIERMHHPISDMSTMAGRHSDDLPPHY